MQAFFKLTDASTLKPPRPSLSKPQSRRGQVERSETCLNLPSMVKPKESASIPGLKSRKYVSSLDITDVADRKYEPGYSQSKLESLLSKRRSDSPSTSPTVSFAKENSFMEDSQDGDRPSSLKRETSGLYSPREADFYLQVQLLKSGDTFGLADLQFDDEVETTGFSMSVVSDGAEVIMLKKQFFITYADEEVKEHLRQNRLEYPSENTIRDNLKIKLNWDTYRGTVLQNVLERQQDLHLLRQKSLISAL